MNDNQGNLFEDLGNLEELPKGAAGEWQGPPREPDAPSATLDLLMDMGGKAAAEYDERQEAFNKFHAENPAVYRQLVTLARQATATGATKLGARELWERLRWYFKFETKDRATDYKLNNNYCAYYARLIMETENDLAGIFELRKLKHERGGECEHST